MNPVDRTFRSARVMWSAFMIYSVFVIAMAEGIRKPNPDPPIDLFLPLLIIALGETTLAIFFFKMRKIAEIEIAIREAPDTLALAQKWLTFHIFCFVLAQAAVLLGWVLRFMGLELQRTGIFYAIGLITLVLCAPRRP
jgi:hypothetical protein